jgi:hypothetical protein
LAAPFRDERDGKAREGGEQPDRDTQFNHINATVKAAIAAGDPALSVDTKKKGLAGDFKNNGRELRPKSRPEAVRVHDFMIPERGKAAPCGVYDIAANHGLGQCRHRCGHRRLCCREHPLLVVQAWPGALPRCHATTLNHQAARGCSSRNLNPPSVSPTRPD